MNNKIINEKTAEALTGFGKKVTDAVIRATKTVVTTELIGQLCSDLTNASVKKYAGTAIPAGTFNSVIEKYSVADLKITGYKVIGNLVWVGPFGSLTVVQDGRIVAVLKSKGGVWVR